MDETGLIKNRRILPRWREISRMPAYELMSTDTMKPHIQATDENLKDRYSEWQENPTIENALEVLCSAQMANNKPLAYGAAEQILKMKSVLPETRRLAENIRYAPAPHNDEDSHLVATLDLFQDQTRTKIHNTKQRLINEPKNGILWLEYARLQALLGHGHKAEEGIKRAIATAPNNRVILRAGARFLIHRNEHDFAYRSLRNAETIKLDPWIQAAEIAVAGLMDQSPISIKRGKSLIAHNSLHPIHLSELSAAVGTEEIKNGNNKAGRKFFENGLVKPTENTIAQAFWAQKHISIELNSQQFSLPRAYEARAGMLYAENNFLGAVQNCINWCADEPFSASPAILGTYIASVYLDDQKRACDIFEFARQTNPNDYRLLNNGAVALAKLGRTDDAMSISNKMDKLLGEQKEPTTIATKGLISFRMRQYEQGRNLYKQATLLARADNNIDLEIRVVIHWATEEAHARTISYLQINDVIKRIDAVIQQHRQVIKSSTTKLWDFYRSRLSKAPIESPLDDTPPELLSLINEHEYKNHKQPTEIQTFF